MQLAQKCNFTCFSGHIFLNSSGNVLETCKDVERPGRVLSGFRFQLTAEVYESYGKN